MFFEGREVEIRNQLCVMSRHYGLLHESFKIIKKLSCWCHYDQVYHLNFRAPVTQQKI